MLDIKEKRHITVVGRGGASNIDWDDIENKPDFAEVATSGSYNDLTDKPTILTQWFGTQAEYDAIETKDPNTIYNIEGGGQVQANWTENDSSDPSYIQNKPTLATVATSGSYSDLSNTPSLATVATSGSYNDLTNKPDMSHYVEDTDLASVATSGSYNDLSDKPTIPNAQVNSDWDATSGVSQILNKPTVPDETETLTFTLQGGTTVTMNVYVKPDYTKTYFFVQDLSGNGGTLTFQAMDGEVLDFDLYTSTDQINWTLAGRMEMFAYFQVPIPAGGKVYIKAHTDRWGADEWFESDVLYAVGGNLMSLLYSDNFKNVTTFTPDNYRCFYFHGGNNLYDASKLVLPATALTEECYYQMFSGCTSLTQAPALPATNLATSCYSNMFSGCTSLTTAPALPATTLAENCYLGMFNGCTSLTTSPVLPAATLAIGCYMSMFDGCSSLDTITTYAEGEAPDALSFWVHDVAASGDFYNLGNYQNYERGFNGIPEGWTEHTSL